MVSTNLLGKVIQWTDRTTGEIRSGIVRAIGIDHRLHDQETSEFLFLLETYYPHKFAGQLKTCNGITMRNLKILGVKTYLKEKTENEN